MEKVNILQIGPYPEWDIEALARNFILHPYYAADDKAAFIEGCAGVIRGVATRGDRGLSRELIEALPHLEIIAVYGVGYDAVDLDAARERNIRVTNTPDVLTNDVADFGVAMMLAASRGIIGGEHWVRSGDWSNKGMYPLRNRVFGKRAGILGLGRIGYQVARRCAAFEMDIAYSDLERKEGPDDWSYIRDPRALAERSDYLFVTTTGGAATKHIVNKAVIEALGPEGMLINISRASNIDEEALLTALENRTLGYAALDVFEGEPKVNARFFELDNVMLQPHQASATVDTRKEMGRLVRENLEAHFSGRELLTPVI
ncbi:MAG: 2-hydroxyacid dehydrogenase [Desulfofustis sp.]|jgi:lactate dehydrogenase-like 2-hydroxyacid dehydrogenase|nr:2-hydroxyacid dehydrogenase [Desulfofustis sp.]